MNAKRIERLMTILVGALLALLVSVPLAAQWDPPGDDDPCNDWRSGINCHSASTLSTEN